MKKVYLGIFIAIFAIIAMSHNASAIDFSLNFNDYELVRNDYRNGLDVFYDSNTTSCNGVTVCTVYNSNNFASVKRLRTHGAFNLVMDDIVVFRVFVGSQSGSGPFTSISPFIQRNFTTGQDYLLYVGMNEYRVDNYNILSSLGYGPNADEFYTNIKTYYKDLRIYEYFFKVQANGSYYVGFESNNYNSVIADIFTLAAYSTDDSVYFRSMNTQVYRYNKSPEEEAAEKELESTDNIENQTPPSSSETGDGVQATNLISAFSGFVSALGGLSATNCNLTLNFPTFAGGSRVVNVCQNKDKAGNIITVFSSLTLIVFYVPLAIRLLTMIYNEIRSFTNG